MKLKFFLNIVLFLSIQASTLSSKQNIEDQSPCYTWAVIGAGFAGITALAVLIDAGVDPSTIAWIDPEFNVGRVGKYYCNVPGNIKAIHLVEYVNNCPYFKDIVSPSRDKIYTYDPEEFQLLQVIVDPLLDFTAYLSNQVTPIKALINSLEYNNDHWLLAGTNCSIHANKVILAVGAQPKRLNYDLPEIPLDDAIDKKRLATYLSSDDCVAVFGGMHSAILILKYLSECPVKKIINFYLTHYFYDSPGLEGITAMWANNILDKNPPSNLLRVLNNAKNRDSLLPLCTKVIYAIGYEPNKILVNGSLDLSFDEDSGIIEPDLYGIGIAFPPTGIINGQKIPKNGLATYLAYAKRLIPQWIISERSSTYPHKTDKDQELPWI